MGEDPYLGGVDCDILEPPPEGAMKGKKSVTFQKLWTVRLRIVNKVPAIFI